MHHFTGEKYRGQWKGPEPQAMWTKGMEFLKRPITPCTPTFLQTKHEGHILLLGAGLQAAQSPTKRVNQTPSSTSPRSPGRLLRAMHSTESKISFSLMTTLFYR